jgi:hypothetical protein
MLNWIAEPCKNILALIPAIRGNRVEIDPPQDHFFVLKTDSGYFVRFHHILPGCRVSPNVKHAARMDNLLIAAAMALFWKGEGPDPASNETIFVEAVRRSAVEYKPRRRHWYSENSSEVVLAQNQTTVDELVKNPTREEISASLSR